MNIIWYVVSWSGHITLWLSRNSRQKTKNWMLFWKKAELEEDWCKLFGVMDSLKFMLIYLYDSVQYFVGLSTALHFPILISRTEVWSMNMISIIAYILLSSKIVVSDYPTSHELGSFLYRDLITLQSKRTSHISDFIQSLHVIYKLYAVYTVW